MARSPSQNPTDLELEILKVLWKLGPSTVRTVRDDLAGHRPLAHTTVITVMKIMTDKGYLTRERAKEGKGHIYRPRVQERSVRRRMLSDLRRRVFDGSASAMVLNLIDDIDLDENALKELRRRIDEKAKEASR